MVSRWLRQAQLSSTKALSPLLSQAKLLRFASVYPYILLRICYVWKRPRKPRQNLPFTPPPGSNRSPPAHCQSWLDRVDGMPGSCSYLGGGDILKCPPDRYEGERKTRTATELEPPDCAWALPMSKPCDPKVLGTHGRTRSARACPSLPGHKMAQRHLAALTNIRWPHSLLIWP